MLGREGFWGAVLALLLPAAAMGACPPASFTRGDLLELKERAFAIGNSSTRDALALALLDCLGDPDPVLRDGVAFEALSTWMGSGQVSKRVAGQIFGVLLPRLAPDYPDPRGFVRPFSALVLVEVARMDRLDPFLDDGQLNGLVAAGTGFLEGVEDYRGFDEREGWRHAVAHGADLMLQLSLNPRVGPEQLDRILSAVASQVGPAGEHFYVYGEPERLAQAAYYVASRGLVTEESWTRWLSAVSDPAPLTDWSEAFASQVGLAKRHNTAAFLLALYLMANEGGDAFAERLRPGLTEAIRRVP